MEERLKYAVSYGRVVQTQPYETLKISLMMEHYIDEMPMEYAFKEAKEKVEAQIKTLEVAR